MASAALRKPTFEVGTFGPEFAFISPAGTGSLCLNTKRMVTFVVEAKMLVDFGVLQFAALDLLDVGALVLLILRGTQ